MSKTNQTLQAVFPRIKTEYGSAPLQVLTRERCVVTLLSYKHLGNQKGIRALIRALFPQLSLADFEVYLADGEYGLATIVPPKIWKKVPDVTNLAYIAIVRISAKSQSGGQNEFTWCQLMNAEVDGQACIALAIKLEGSIAVPIPATGKTMYDELIGPETRAGELRHKFGM